MFTLFVYFVLVITENDFHIDIMSWPANSNFYGNSRSSIFEVVEMLEKVQKRATKLIPTIKNGIF